MRLPLFSSIIVLLVLVAAPGECQNTKENADFKLAINLYHDGLYDLAAEQLKQFINAYPTVPQAIEARFYLGLTQLKLKNYDDARLTFQTFALTYQDNPRAPEAWWNVGESYAALRNNREAALAFERVKVFHPKSKSAADALLQASHYFMLAGDRDNARRVLRVILQEYPTSGAVMAARTDLARIYAEEGNLEQAQGELKRVVEGDPSPDAKAQALLILGTITQATGNIDQAQDNFEEILKNYGSSSAAQGAHVGLGKLLAASGKHAEALDHFRKALSGRGQADSTYTKDAMIGAGDASAALRDYPGAIGSYERFLAASPDDERVPQVLAKLSEAAARGKNYRRSNDAANRLLKLTASDNLKKRALIRLGLNAEEQNQPQQAQQYFIAYAEQYQEDPFTAEVTFRLARLTDTTLKDPRRAATFYEILVNRNPQSPLVDDAIFGAGQCYEEAKDFEKALQSYKELLSTYAGTDFRNAARDRIRTVESFETKSKDAGLEKLALLVGDVVGDQDKSLLAFRLGEIYFTDLKNFQAAAAQFTTALAGNPPEPKASDARYYVARSYELLSWRDSTYRAKGAEAYRRFIAGAPNDPRAVDAALSLFTLSATSLQAAKAAYDSTIRQYPTFPRMDALHLRLGTLLEQADSAGAALGEYAEIIRISMMAPSVEEAAYRRVALLQKMGLGDSVITEGEAFIDRYPSGEHTPWVLSTVAGLQLQHGNAQRAAEQYTELTTRFFYTDAAADARLRLAEAYTLAGNYDGAVTVYEGLAQQQLGNPLSTGSIDPSLQLALGKAYHQAGKDNLAKKYLIALVNTERTGEIAGRAYMALGLIARGAGALDAAAAYFRQAEIAAPGLGTTREIADLLFDRGEYAEAIKQYGQLLAAAQTDDDRRMYEARIIVAKLRSRGPGAVEKDIAAFKKKYSGADEEMATFQLERGLYFYQQEDYAKARAAFQTIVSDYDQTAVVPQGMYWIARTLEAEGKPQEAVQHLDRLLKEYPASDIIPKAHLALGGISYNAERWDEAIRHYRLVVDNPKVDPSLLPMAMSNLIETYEASSANDAALALTRRYLEQYPTADDVLDKKIKIGILYSKLGYYDQAILQLQSLLPDAGSDLEAELRYYIAEANYNKGDFQQAILDFLKVPYLVTKKGKIDWTANSFYMAGQAYEKMGRFDQALTMYQQIVDRPNIDPTYKAAAKKEIDRVKTVLKKSN